MHYAFRPHRPDLEEPSYEHFLLSSSVDSSSASRNPFFEVKLSFSKFLPSKELECRLAR